MPLAGKGMLLTSMDIDASDEAEFNRWYDREHLLERVKNMIRAVARITVSRGTGRGAALGIVRLRPAGDTDKLHTALRDQLDPEKLDGILSMHLIESDPALSRPITDDPPVSDPGSGDWFVLIDGTDVKAVSAALAARLGNNPAFKPAVISTGVYNLVWDLAKSDIPLS